MDWQFLLSDLSNDSYKSLARAISLVENHAEGYLSFLQQLPPGKAMITGVTGAPGAGKSTLSDALIHQWVSQGKKVGVVCVDPSSPFHLGALLGDRIRMSAWYNHPNVYIRSLATRGSLGGLHPQIIEISAILQAAGFDELLIETVGVGQSEIEIAGLADTTVVVLVPEAGDEVQTMKSGLMEIADIFVVNKSDRPDADQLVKHLRGMLAGSFVPGNWEIPILKTIATQQSGIAALAKSIEQHQQLQETPERKKWLLAEKAYQLISRHRMRDVSKQKLVEKIAEQMVHPGFNLFQFLSQQFHS
ncbi:MAG: methylmalonyl Co-A mutase-associated GTPase MeaB [Chitinophagaceae bacterium]|jgi:LAO/AO transport system kinase|nr:methylmalonyl Co-A mutase-associated GTPase MeaB [Chitinophagaceae bacterium]MCA6467554.1 methylmalonyl Co-A mutase-associated GTPase MeaB [Chitinophagaceae bacterium]MCA6483294.1 methylmalonyl Co-A mutase-associated GTPase MeaB [Chitinophagaceae bacterium]MCA6484158.1 methylmalonyl Co-A mutase-associated GTPase MeaB [Chitinophagaceae bacterium]MCA6490528.1 methylmalonyl Co-A mutase-associated GTPase MeaB [Chitinophagaceae bacterium]